MQVYAHVDAREIQSIYTCLQCGAVVYNMARHDAWHRQNGDNDG